MVDVIVVGGSYAGLAAALQLARARRKVLIVDAGRRRNRFAKSAHGFLGYDGSSPEAIALKGRADVLAYETVSFEEGEVSEIRKVEGGFSVRTSNGTHTTKRVVLATGVADELPAVVGLQERWGKTVFHCPYCHGYELNLGRIGVLATSPLAVHSAMLASEWSAPRGTTLFLDGSFELEAVQLEELEKRAITIERRAVVRLAGEAPKLDVCLGDGAVTSLDGMFVVAHTSIQGPFASQLGCELEAGPVGNFYKTDMTKETTVPGVFACGDTALAMGSVSFAVADGAMAGFGVHKSLVFPR